MVNEKIDTIHMSVVSIVALLDGLESNIYFRSIILMRCFSSLSCRSLVSLTMDLYKECVRNRTNNAIAPPKIIRNIRIKQIR